MKVKVYGLWAVLVCVNIQIAHSQFKTVRIGNKTWMAENLNTPTEGSYIYNDNAQLAPKFGRLYTWDAAMKACPAGWHLPSDAEWTDLVTRLGGEDVAGGKLKINGESGFNAPLAGYADGHSFWFAESFGGFWTSTSYSNTHAWYRFFSKKDDSFTNTYFSKHYGFSIRCVKN
jgi:uncharacterized protein (TIGR02145 family)